MFARAGDAVVGAMRQHRRMTAFSVGASPQRAVGDHRRCGSPTGNTSRALHHAVAAARCIPALFGRIDGRRQFRSRAPHETTPCRVRGIPASSPSLEVEPGVYALDSVFAAYPRRPGELRRATASSPGRSAPVFEVRPGEAIYLGIWQMDLEEVTAVTRPWRSSRSRRRGGDARCRRCKRSDDARRTRTQAVACEPHQLGALSQRQIC